MEWSDYWHGIGNLAGWTEKYGGIFHAVIIIQLSSFGESDILDHILCSKKMECYCM